MIRVDSRGVVHVRSTDDWQFMYQNPRHMRFANSEYSLILRMWNWSDGEVRAVKLQVVMGPATYVSGRGTYGYPTQHIPADVASDPARLQRILNGHLDQHASDPLV